MERTLMTMKFETMVLVVLILCGVGRSVSAQVDDRGPMQNTTKERNDLLGIAPASDSFHILLVTVDGLNPEFLGCYGGKGGITPNFDALAARGVRFTQAFASTPRRSSGIVSLIKSQYPTVIEQIGDTDLTPSVGPQFADRGFSISAVINNKALALDGARLGDVALDLGFGRNITQSLSPDSITKYFERIIASRRDEQILTWVHLPYTQFPATTHPGFDFGPTPEQHYLAAVRCADDTFGRLVELLRKNQLEENTITIVMAPTPTNGAANGSDPAQNTLNDASLRVPLIVFVPGLKSKVASRVVETIDVVPTLLSLSAKACGYSMQGRSFVSDLLPDDGASKAEPRDGRAFAFAPALAGADAQTERISVRTEKWRLVQVPTERRFELYDVTGDATKDVSAEHQDVVKRLSSALEEIAIFNTSCADAWRRGETSMPKMSGTDGDFARARWLARENDPRARGFASKLLEKGDVDRAEALRILFRVGSEKETSSVERLLSEADPTLRSLSGAYVARFKKDKSALDYALTGLRDDMPERDLLLVIESIGIAGTPETRKVLEKFDPKEASKSVRAARRLALARLGDSAALDSLVEFILDPEATFDKAAYIDVLVDAKKKEAAPVLSLVLTDGDQRSSTVAHVIKKLEELDARDTSRAIASKLLHPDRDVRILADRTLRGWHSSAGYRQWSSLISTSDDDLTWTATSLAATTGLLSSPLLPGARLDAVARQSPETTGTLENGFPLLDRRSLTFNVTVADPSVSTVVAVFRVKDDDSDRADLLKISLNVNGKFIPQRSLQKSRGKWYWSGNVREGSFEAGTNEIQFRMTRNTAEVALFVFETLMIIPGNAASLEPIGGIDSDTTTATFDVPRGLNSVHLHWNAAGRRDEKSAMTTIRISDKSGEIASVKIPAGGGSEDRIIDIGERPWSRGPFKLEFVDANKDAQILSAALYGTR